MTVQTMPLPVQYVTAENGQRVGVLLSWREFQQLQLRQSDDPDLLSGLSIAELQALAAGMLSAQRQAELSALLAENDSTPLAAEDAEELDRLLEQIDVLSILKARARLTLQSLASNQPESTRQSLLGLSYLQPLQGSTADRA